MNKEEIEEIENPIVRRALQRRCADFMFNYGDYEEYGGTHVDEDLRRYNDVWKKYTDHKDYVEPEPDWDQIYPEAGW